MTVVSYGVVGHGSRRIEAESLAHSLGAVLSVDDGSLGSVVNHDHVWASASQAGAEYTVVLEDDAVPVPGFTRHVSDALDSIPRDGACSFYIGGGSPDFSGADRAVLQAQLTDASWWQCRHMMWGVALAFPTRYVPELLDRASYINRPYDERFGAAVKAMGMWCFYTVPSLVDHADGPSLLSSKNHSRSALLCREPQCWNKKIVSG